MTCLKRVSMCTIRELIFHRSAEIDVKLVMNNVSSLKFSSLKKEHESFSLLLLGLVTSSQVFRLSVGYWVSKKENYFINETTHLQFNWFNVQSFSCVGIFIFAARPKLNQISSVPVNQSVNCVLREGTVSWLGFSHTLTHCCCGAWACMYSLQLLPSIYH